MTDRCPKCGEELENWIGTGTVCSLQGCPACNWVQWPVREPGDEGLEHLESETLPK